MKQPVVLMVLDGWGLRNGGAGNAITAAGPVNFNKLAADYPYTELEASGWEVGLPDGQMGNSEVGHLNLGSGRIVYQEMTRISTLNNTILFSNRTSDRLCIKLPPPKLRT